MTIDKQAQLTHKPPPPRVDGVRGVTKENLLARIEHQRALLHDSPREVLLMDAIEYLIRRIG